jgi:fumarate reductase subunit C
VGVVRLAQGEDAWNGWVAALKTPWSVLLHAVLLVSFFVHAKSWFEIMPKTMPLLFVGGQRVPGPTITRWGWIASIVASIVLLGLAAWGAS